MYRIEYINEKGEKKSIEYPLLSQTMEFIQKQLEEDMTFEGLVFHFDSES